MTGSAAPFTNFCESLDLEFRPTRLASGANEAWKWFVDLTTTSRLDA